MSPQIDPQIERLIVRRLDGELTPDEQLELDRVLLKDPAARDLLEAYGRIDRAAGDALALAFEESTEVVTPPVVRLADQRQPRRLGYSKLWWSLPAAIAAAIALMVLLTDPANSTRKVAVVPTQTPASVDVPSTQNVTADGTNPILQAGFAPDRIDRSTTTDALYILGADGNLYVIEQQRISTARKPSSGIVLVSGDL